MNIEYSHANSFSEVNATLFAEWYPERAQREQELQRRLRYRSEHDPEQPPRPERGDKYILAGALVGIVIGGAAGAIVAGHYFGFIGYLFGFWGGVIVGGIIGVLVGDVIRKRRQKQKTNARKSS
jgi:MFS family permease